MLFRSQDRSPAAMFLVEPAFESDFLHPGDPTPKDAENRGLRAKLVRSSGNVLAAGLVAELYRSRSRYHPSIRAETTAFLLAEDSLPLKLRKLGHPSVDRAGGTGG